MATTDVTDRFFRAIEQHDLATVAELYAPDIEIWHGHTGDTLDRNAGLAVLGALMQPGVDLNYEVLEQLTSGARVARRHLLHFRIGRRAPVTVPVSIYLTVDDGKITRIDEYLDGKPAKKVVRRMTAHIGVVRAVRTLLGLRWARRRGRFEAGRP